jgi:hypothetical protein
MGNVFQRLSSQRGSFVIPQQPPQEQLQPNLCSKKEVKEDASPPDARNTVEDQIIGKAFTFCLN